MLFTNYNFTISLIKINNPLLSIYFFFIYYYFRRYQYSTLRKIVSLTLNEYCSETVSDRKMKKMMVVIENSRPIIDSVHRNTGMTCSMNLSEKNI